MTESVFAIAVCNRCGGASQPGAELAAHLMPLGPGEGFRVETVVCFAGCERPLAVAFTAPAKAAFLFGDIDPVADADSLVSFGRLYRDLSDGWCRESERPAGLRGKTLARIPFIAGLEGLSR
ncbi:DUF1636 domain-containing protein [Ensifer sp. LCM 4579]|uniref:DUF1636 domain-containing protein n=1 Tax=Ensifer sp. LCM 4579 TaxID=1848292 RepID=UPI0008DA87DC|nr:DUF1636 domain-containing protein [Ensifer sp. LCM 4579]OHV83876.1 hypothetical protein LCM4579_15055 [Ensifer sp. LCM 4579]